MTANVPMNIEMERTVLGGIMIFDSGMAFCHDADLQSEEFYLAQHQTLYAAMLEMDERKMPLDSLSVISYLRDSNKLDVVGGENYILDLADAAVSDTVISAYITEIQNKAQQRAIMHKAAEIQNMDASQGIDEYLDVVEHMITSVTRNRRGSEFEKGADVSNRVLNEIAQLRTQKGVTGIKTDLRDLDRITNGFQRGDLIILAARPAMGKSALALNLVNMVARNNPGNVALFSLEMPADSLMKRLLSCESQVVSEKLRNGRVTDQEMSKLHRAANALSERNIFIDDTSAITPNLIYSKCKKLRSEYGDLSLIVIDYLQLIEVSNSSGASSRQQEVSEISRKLKLLAKDMNCPVIALSQLSRRVEERTDHEPQLSDLRESGSIEQDADIVMFLYRKAYYDKEEEKDPEVVDLSLAKHRNGSTGRVNMVFEKSISKFSSISREDSPS